LLGLTERSGSYHGGELPRHFISGDNRMIKELSVFVDESGDFGLYKPHSPFYVIAFVFHDQSVDITENIRHLNSKIHYAGLPDYTVHTGPLIRRESEYFNLTGLERKRIFNFLYNFARTADIAYHTLVVEKRQLVEEIDLNIRITKQLSAFLYRHIEDFARYDRVIVYYDYGQMELTNILVSVFNTVLNNVKFKKISPANYKLFQAADMLCTLELLSLKADRKMLSKSEIAFFSSARNLRKAYLNAIQKKRFEKIE
jgi:hypothetical protein